MLSVPWLLFTLCIPGSIASLPGILATGDFPWLAEWCDDVDRVLCGEMQCALGDRTSSLLEVWWLVWDDVGLANPTLLFDDVIPLRLAGWFIDEVGTPLVVGRAEKKFQRKIIALSSSNEGWFVRHFSNKHVYFLLLFEDFEERYFITCVWMLSSNSVVSIQWERYSFFWFGFLVPKTKHIFVLRLSCKKVTLV